MRVRSPITILCAFANEAIGEILHTLAAGEQPALADVRAVVPMDDPEHADIGTGIERRASECEGAGGVHLPPPKGVPLVTSGVTSVRLVFEAGP